MKKIYQAPEVNVVRIETHQILAGSELGFGDPAETASGAESRRRGGFWDDEDEDY